MVRLAYLFWAFPIFFIGCTKTVYTEQFLSQETATVSPAGLVFDPPALAAWDGYGRDQVHGVSFNRRAEFVATNGYYGQADTTFLRTRFYDRHHNRDTDDGYLNRTVTEYRTAFRAR